MLSVHLIMHFGRKEQANDDFLKGVIGQNELFALLYEDYKWALANETRKDFEDALQLAVAIRSGCETFVTLDTKIDKVYVDLPIKIITV